MSPTSTDVSTQDVVERALQLSRTQGCIVIAQESSEANLRWAANTLTTNGVMRGRSLTVIATAPAGEGIATGDVSRSNVGLDEVEALVREAEQRAENGRPVDDAHPLIDGSDVPESGRGSTLRPRRRSVSSPTWRRRSGPSSARPARAAGSSSDSPSTRSSRPTSACRPGSGCGTCSPPAGSR